MSIKIGKCYVCIWIIYNNCYGIKLFGGFVIVDGKKVTTDPLPCVMRNTNGYDVDIAIL